MPTKLVPQLCFFNSSLPSVCFPSVKIGTSIRFSRVSPIFSHVFPFKLKYSGISYCPLRNDQVSIRPFSTRSFQPRTDSRSGSGFNRRNERKRNLCSKSLTEDEADLSEWISELRKDSFRGPNAREEFDNDHGRSRSSFRDRESFLTKRRKSHTEEFGDLSQRRTRGPMDSYPKRTQGFRRNGTEFQEDDSKGEFGASSRQRTRGPMDSYLKSTQGFRRNNGEFRNNDSKGKFGTSIRQRTRGPMDSYPKSTQEDDSKGEFGSSSRQRTRGPMDSYLKSTQGFRRNSGEFRNNDIKGKFGTSIRQRTRGPMDSYPKRTQGFRRNDREFGDNDSSEVDSRRKRFGFRGKSENSLEGRKRGMEMNFDSRQTRTADTFRKIEKNFDTRQVWGDENFQKSEKRFREQVHLVENDDSDDEDGEDLMDSFGDFLKEGDNEDEDSPNDDESDGYLMKESSSSLYASDKEVSKVDSTITKSLAGKSETYLSDTRFDQCSISPLSLKGIMDAGYEKMTVVQEATLPAILKGKDVLAKAKTGTGKTIAFLLPSIEVVVNSAPLDRDQKRPPIIVLVICPTRELASQAFAEANTLLKYHPSIGVQVVIGGTRLALEQKTLQANPCQILVATPGRLRDHTENTAGFATRLMGVKVLVLDEADHLLDMGFRKEIERIITAVPKQRQTLLFSATVPEEVRQICHIALKRDHEFINTVEEGSEETHSQVRQRYIIAPLEKHFPLLYTILKEHIANDVDYKVLVFCTTAMVTKMVANLLSELNLNVREIHSRKAQSHRTKVSDEFRKSKGLILVTSDVSARGVDYPDVTLVIQVGLPADRQQYIHRLGRTGRKGKEGQGILLLTPWEEFFLLSIKDLPLSKAPEPLLDTETKKKVERALSLVEMKNKEAAYQAWLGYYNSNKNIGKEKYKLVELANEFSHSMGLDNPPAIPKLVLGKMGLRNVPGLRSM